MRRTTLQALTDLEWTPFALHTVTLFLYVKEPKRFLVFRRHAMDFDFYRNRSVCVSIHHCLYSSITAGREGHFVETVVIEPLAPPPPSGGRYR